MHRNGLWSCVCSSAASHRCSTGCRQSCHTNPELAPTRKDQMQVLDTTDGTCMATQAAHTPQVSPQPGTVCNTNRGTRSLESITSSAVLRPSAADSSSSWRKEKVIPSTALTTTILPILRTRLFTVLFQSEISDCQSCFKEKWLDTEDK